MFEHFTQAREPINSYTHFIGACLGVLGTCILILYCIARGKTEPSSVIGALVFGFSLIALYSASSVYHYVKGNAKTINRLRKLDHGMIFVLIAGTYTPLCLRFMEPRNSIIFLSAIWSVAVLGNIIKQFWLSAPRWLSTLLYLIMGWAILFDFGSFKSIPLPCLSLIAAGGVSYSVGAVIYALKKPNLSNQLGFHEIFHIFVILGSVLHFIAIFIFVI